MWVYPFQLGWVYPWAVQLGWVDLGSLHLGLKKRPIFCSKNDIFVLKTKIFFEFVGISDMFLKFLSCSLIFFDIFGPSLAEIGSNTNPGDSKRRHGCESMGLSSQTDPPRTPGRPSRPPQTPPGGFGKIVSKKMYCDILCNLLAVTRSRFAGAGDGSPRLNVS